MFVEPEAARIRRRRTLACVGPFRAYGDVDEACLEVDDAVFGVEESASESDIEFGAVESDTDIILEPDWTIELGGHEFILRAEELHFCSRDLFHERRVFVFVRLPFVPIACSPALH